MASSKEFYHDSTEEKLFDSSEDFQKRLRTMEYETQFFGFSPLAYYDFLKKYASNQIKTELGKQADTIAKQLSDTEVMKCNSATERLIQKTDAKVELAFNKTESKFLNVFSIPSNILLPEDEIQRNQYTEEDVKQIDSEVKNLEKRFKRCLYLESFFEEELEESTVLDSIEKELMKVEDKISNELEKKLEYKLKSWENYGKVLNDYNSVCELYRKVVGLEL